MKNNQLKNILKLAINLSLSENKDIVPYLKKAYETIELNEYKKTKIEKSKKEKNTIYANKELAKNKIKMIDELIKKESEILNKSIEMQNNTSEKSNQLFLS